MDILIVDDSAVMRRVVLKSMQLSGIPLGAVHQAGNGQEALNLLEREHVSLALVDINMPVMDGVELIDRLRGDARTADLPVIVVSTESSPARLASVKAHGVACIKKPFSPEQLIDAVMGAIGGANGSGLDVRAACGSGPDF